MVLQRKPEDEILTNNAKKSRMENGDAKPSTNGVHHEEVEVTSDFRFIHS